MVRLENHVSLHIKGLFTMIAVVFVLQNRAGADTKKAWELLLDNKPTEASEEFRKTTSDPNSMIAGESYRGLAATDMFLGNFENVLDYGITSYEKDGNVLKSASRPDILLLSRHQSDKSGKRVAKVLSDLAKNSGLFSGWYQDAQLKSCLSSGDSKKAKELHIKMGIQSKWKFIGPFENISNCGFSNVYPPEKEIRFDKEYDGKNGNIVRWNDLFTTESRGWIFLDNITNDYNSIYYFTNTVFSRQQQDLLISFGASGTFKVYVNGVLALQDSVFRNTGIDAYMQNVTLREGLNRIVVKIGHEGVSSVGQSGRSNFLLRFLNKNYRPVTDLQTAVSDTAVVSDKKPFVRMSNSPVIDSLTGFLHTRIKKDSTDYDALFALITMYNMYEMTNESQQFIQHYLKRKSLSSLLHSSLAESQMRAKKYTDAAVSMKKAYDLCNLNMLAWSRQLETIKNGGNLRSLEEFLKKSPESLRKKSAGMLVSLTIAIAQKNRSEMLRLISELETNYKDDNQIALTLISIYAAQGMIDKAEKMLEEQIKQNPDNTMLYFELAQLLLKRGNRDGAAKWYQAAMGVNPEDPDGYLLMSNHCYQEKNYTSALDFAEKCALLTPSNANVMNLKGNILASMGKTEEAIASFKKTIRYTSDDFTAWESIFRLNKQSSFEDLTPLPSVDSIIAASSAWVKKSNNKPSLVHFTEDIYMYPSRATRSRTFMVVHLPNQQAIDEWKEYRIPYNPNYQILTVDRALSKKTDGSEVEADHENNYVVFKSLEPGDCIVLEYSQKDYYQGVMSGKVYGTQLFGNDLPEFSSMVRMVTPIADSIPYFCSDTSLSVQSKIVQECKITTIKCKSSTSQSIETFTPQYYPGNTALVYSNFKSWKEIADWYYELSRHKQKRTIELANLADSLVKGVTTEWQKILRIHEHMSRTVNYSYVPFRQSAWIPQAAGDVFATRIGDCKDMASLGKAIMDIAGIESWLVLVNTGIRHYTGFAHIGPNFDHCILSFRADGKNYFVDFTSRNTALGNLPAGDQGAMALVIKPGNDSLITLPMDSATDRTLTRKITMEIDTNGTMNQTVTTKRTGVYAASLRELYRFIPYNEQKKTLHKSITEEYPDVVLDTLVIQDIDSIKDSINYTYKFSADHAAEISNSTVILPLKIPDALEARSYPVEENRKQPVDMSYSSAGITEQTSILECQFPPKWKLMNVPQAVKTESGAINYSLEFSVKGNTLTCKRSFKSNFTGILSGESYKKELSVLKTITRADDIKLIFTK